MSNITSKLNDRLFSDIRDLIIAAKKELAVTVNAGLTIIYWRIGKRIQEEIVYALSRQLSWTHFRTLIYIQDPLKRDFYAEMSRLEGWSSRVLQERIDSMLFERTALSKKPDTLLAQELSLLKKDGQVTPDLVLKDPYLLDFLGIQDRYLEKDLEDAILRELENSLQEACI